MTRYLALLGSINIGGNRIKMADLRAALSAGGLRDVQTIAASGNVVLSSDEAPEALAQEISHIIREAFGFDSLVTLRSHSEVRSAVTDNPYHGDGTDQMVHSIFLTAQPKKEDFDGLVAEHQARGAERLALGDRVMYLDYVHGVGVSDLTGRFIERRLGCRGTARNMRSLKRILEKMEETA